MLIVKSPPAARPGPPDWLALALRFPASLRRMRAEEPELFGA
jgi:hypothetical protein